MKQCRLQSWWYSLLRKSGLYFDLSKSSLGFWNELQVPSCKSYSSQRIHFDYILVTAPLLSFLVFFFVYEFWGSLRGTSSQLNAYHLFSSVVLVSHHPPFGYTLVSLAHWLNPVWRKTWFGLMKSFVQVRPMSNPFFFPLTPPSPPYSCLLTVV